MILNYFITWIAIFLVENAASKKCGYDSCPKSVPDKLNVHLVPHTHDDVGWLKTVDQYYYGSKDSVHWANAGVQYILDTVVPHLVEDPTKRFIYVETAYFWRWWEEQNDQMKSKVRKLIENGQLEFILGGWCMNDEATVHYTAMIQQLSLGVDYLSSLFGECGHPLIGWQIDPFGHSKVQAEIFAKAQFDGLFFGRADYQDKNNRQANRSMEFIWQSVESGKFNSGSLFTGLNEHGYNPPDGFCYDWVCEGDDPIMDDPRLNDYNVDDVIRRFKAAAEDQRKHFQGNNIMMTMGSDFQYRNAYMWYKNLDKLIKYVNAADVGLNLFYSTPSCYLKSKHEDFTNPSEGFSMSEVTDDFFPYADGPHMFWTGYFTSRAALKRYVRESNPILNQCKRANIMLDGAGVDRLAHMERSFAVLQHHDAVSGTERQLVAYDYAERLSRGRDSCFSVIKDSYEEIFGQNDIIECEYRNISICNVVEASQFSVYFENHRQYSHFIRIPVKLYSGQRVMKVTTTSTKDGDMIVLTWQANPVMSVLRKLQSLHPEKSRGSHILTVSLPKTLNYRVRIDVTVERTFENLSTRGTKIQKLRKRRALIAKRKIKVGKFVRTRQIKTPYHDAVIRSDGSFSINGIALERPHLFYYDSSTNKTQSSGAYIFRPAKNTAKPFKLTKVKFSDGPVSYDIEYTYATMANQKFRIFKNSPLIEHEFALGPIKQGMEVIVRFNTNVESGDEFYSDMNGRGRIKRKLNHRATWNLDQTEPIAGNYYPINSAISVRDKNFEFTVVPDRAQGGSSLSSGSVELMLLRETIRDDGRGVDEPLMDPGQFGKGLIIKGSHILHFRNLNLSSNEDFVKRLEHFYLEEPFPFFAIGQQQSSYDSTRNVLTYTEVNDVRIVSIESVKKESPAARDGNILLRLEHRCGPGSLFQTCPDVEFNFTHLFKASKISKITEYNLLGNFPKSQRERLQWNVAGGENSATTDSLEDGDRDETLRRRKIVIVKQNDLLTFVIKIL